MGQMQIGAIPGHHRKQDRVNYEDHAERDDYPLDYGFERVLDERGTPYEPPEKPRNHADDEQHDDDVNQAAYVHFSSIGRPAMAVDACDRSPTSPENEIGATSKTSYVRGRL